MSNPSPAGSKKDFPAFLFENRDKLLDAIPFVRAIGLKIDHAAESVVHGRLIWTPELVGDPESEIVAGGVVTTALDSLCGLACGLRLRSLLSIVTLDLRVDYMRPARPHEDILFEAECYHATRTVCFARGIALQGERAAPRIVASAAGAFAITGPAKRRTTAGGEA